MKRAREEPAEMNFVIVGDTCTGKTELIEAMKKPDDECPNPGTPLGMSTTMRVVPTQVVKWDFEAQNRAIQIFNTANQETSQTLLAMSYPKADVIGLIFDMTNKASLEHLFAGDGKCGRIRSWKAHVRTVNRCFGDYILIGTNHDQWELNCESESNSSSSITMEDVYTAAETLEVKAVMLTSHRTKLNVQELRTTIMQLGLNHKASVENPVWTRPEGDEAAASGEDMALDRMPSTIRSDSSVTTAEERRNSMSDRTKIHRAPDDGCCVVC